MITIKVRPKRYSRAALQKEFNLFSESEDDFNEWLTAMQITGQLEEREGYFVPVKAPKEEEKKVAKYMDFETNLFGGKEKAELPRVGIRETWEEKRKYYPTEMEILSFIDATGKEIPIAKEDRLKFTFSKGRERYKDGELIKKGEKWRANLPKPITDKYGIKPHMTVHIKIGAVSKEYYQTLKLWGYAVEAMVSFGETSARVNPRDLELHGWQFPFETQGTIISELTKIGNAAIDVMGSWIATLDLDYARLLTSSRAAGTTTETVPPMKVEGASLYKPFINPPRKTVRVQLYDHDAKTVKPERYTAEGKLPTNWHELDPDSVALLFGFERPSADQVGNAKGYHGRKKDYRKLRAKKTTLDQLKSGKEGEGFK